ncbi:lytic transglycosylase domain-containing protein [Helicobacter mustelae]|uniref:Putative secreted transglycosylase n=1 Tax=Helicobacter mustelae (strain ATCC 43772 / CCUG 25715 / CIP 103759 / LMG 18044 / NCTC 12198 / R85-136P) TaxID=679897 RepID=D3UIT6_HELM1|nr:lytic transglycosylase domain-containing protein [Helicobacter mustelae]CBG40411.1 putative secreted transglycosylase [Helicobacter mustelae 12198]SQH71911.1 secreted transglycosylase [Helicobacter mustelae]STP13051.1 secreted transglycosylase [Helicobacter mustelae]
MRKFSRIFVLFCLASSGVFADFNRISYDRYSEGVLNSFGVSGAYLTKLQEKSFSTSNRLHTKWDFFLEQFDNGYEFIPVLRSIMVESGIPQEFLFLAMAESGFSLRAYSSKKAAGIWQIMPKTAKILGLEINDYLDERRDPIKSTQAAARYLRYLYKNTGEWYLAAMAYNCGIGNLRKAIKKAGTTDIETLLSEEKKYLPRETREYIRMILEMSLAFNNYERLQNSDKKYLLNRGAADSIVGVQIKSGTMLEYIASQLDMSLLELKKYNRQFRYNFLPPGKGDYTVYIPYEKLSYFKQAYTPDENPNRIFVLHKIKKGDTLNRLSKKYKVSVQEIKLANQMEKVFLKVNQKIIIPVVREEYKKLANKGL